MEWRVTDAVYLKTSGHHALILESAHLKLVAQVSSTSGIGPGETLYPIEGAVCLINRDPVRHVSAIYVVPWSAQCWLALQRQVVAPYRSTLPQTPA